MRPAILAESIQTEPDMGRGTGVGKGQKLLLNTPDIVEYNILHNYQLSNY